MQPTERKAFMRCLLASAEVYGKDIGEGAAGIWWRSLEPYSIGEVEKAFAAHIADGDRGRFMPKPADVLQQIRESDGRPGAEEAWAMIPRDEQGSVVWTEEMAQAFGVCYRLIDEGEEIAARMAFKETYQNMVAKARAGAVAVKWTPSLGRDASLRTAALETAVSKGRLTAVHAARLLPSSEASPALAAFAAQLKMLSAVDAVSTE